MKYSIFTMARNEAKAIPAVLDAVHKQSLKPEKVLLYDDGSKDSTAKLAQEAGAIVEIGEPHEYDNTSWKHLERLSTFMKRAANGVDYAILIDGDTILSEDYAERIIGRMQADRVPVASGAISTDGPEEQERIIPQESGLATDCSWWQSAMCPMFPSANIVAHACIGGFRCAVYRDIVIELLRTTGERYSKKTESDIGKYMRYAGYPWWFMLASLAWRRRSLQCCMSWWTETRRADPRIRAWYRAWCREVLRMHSSMPPKQLRKTATAYYILPLV